MNLARWIVALCLAAWHTLNWAAVPAATVTIADGEALVIRAASKWALAEGVRLQPDDIVETTAKTRFVRIEFADGVALDLGPESRALLAPPALGADGATRVHLLRGVAKLSAPAAAVKLLSTPAFTVNTLARSAVFWVQSGEAMAFAESGELGLHERRAGKLASPATLKNGEFFARLGDAKASISPRPSPAFVQRLPHAFLDTLPSRLARFKDRAIEPKALGEISYAEAQPWVDAEGLRGHFAKRWKALAQVPAFREGLETHLSAHPEWDRTLHPEKYLPKQAASDTSRSPAAKY